MADSAGMANPAAQQRQRRANLKLAVVLASVALVFGVGFVAKIVLLGR